MQLAVQGVTLVHRVRRGRKTPSPTPSRYSGSSRVAREGQPDGVTAVDKALATRA